MNSNHRTAIALSTAITLAWILLLQPVFGEVGQKKTNCAEGIGCFDTSELKPPPSTHNKDKSFSPGLGKGIMALPYNSAYDNQPDNIDSFSGSDLTHEMDNCSTLFQHFVDGGRSNSQRNSHPELNATDCIGLDPDPSHFGGFVNKCNFRVVFSFCAFHPAKGEWTESFDCEKTSGGTELIEPHQHLPAHTNHAEMIHWAGCRFPASNPADVKFTPDKRYEFRCYAWDKSEFSELQSMQQECTASNRETMLRERWEDSRRVRDESIAAEKKQKAANDAKLKRLQAEYDAQMHAEYAAQQRAANQNQYAAPVTSMPAHREVAEPCFAEWQIVVQNANNYGDDFSSWPPHATQDQRHAIFINHLGSQNALKYRTDPTAALRDYIVTFTSENTIRRSSGELVEALDRGQHAWNACMARAELAHLQARKSPRSGCQSGSSNSADSGAPNSAATEFGITDPRGNTLAAMCLSEGRLSAAEVTNAPAGYEDMYMRGSMKNNGDRLMQFQSATAEQSISSLFNTFVADSRGPATRAFAQCLADQRRKQLQCR